MTAEARALTRRLQAIDPWEPDPDRTRALLRDIGGAWADCSRSVHELLPVLRRFSTRQAAPGTPAPGEDGPPPGESMLAELFHAFHARLAPAGHVSLSCVTLASSPGQATPRVTRPLDDRIVPTGSGRLDELLVVGDPAEASATLRARYGPPATGTWLGLCSTPDTKTVERTRARATNVALIARALNYTGGIYTPDDVLLELLATGDADAAATLVTLCDGIADSEVLLDTVRVLIHSGGNRNEAARRLFVHRSTLEYRLLRIHELTGINPASPRGLMTLSASLAGLATGHPSAARIPPPTRGQEPADPAHHPPIVP
ncbi:CdaR family transcriptional regulator [Amycolatopsis sp. Hca4]|uniref:PucR family transcriptional regulator n=1 Tax=Amycolatopsis sp. Hca4 TaxID=2742131 RepID=UPI0015929ED4|nr:PucR family transcriptional regulator [Amycolatopsis sp. Hca4]QKV73925.1 helix-turn-helix domain-containing protein [Amycolatopsis sp. Hca4]